MRILITFRAGPETEWAHTRHFDMDQPEYEMLKGDFLSYLNSSASALRGASYHYIDVDTNQLRELIIRFDDVLYIESIIQVVSPDYRPGTRSGNTGPLGAPPTNTTGSLLSRIGGTGTGES